MSEVEGEEIIPTGIDFSRISFNRDERLTEILEKDPTYQRIQAERQKQLGRQHTCYKRMRHHQRMVEKLREERNEIKKKLTAKRLEIKESQKRVRYHARKKEQCRRKLLGLKNSASGRRAKIMHDIKGLMLKQVYREIGLPIPKKLEKIKNLSIYKENQDERNKDR